MSVFFVVPGQPVGKGRPRAVRGANGRPRMVTPAKTREHERCVRLVAADAFGDMVMSGPISVDIVAVFRRPKRLLTKSAPAFSWCTTKPDADNVRKACLDGLQSSGCIDDDSNVVDGRTAKVYASKSNNKPMTIVRVQPVDSVDTAMSDAWLFSMLERARCRNE